ncbi:MAG: S46 family peptidase [Ignavibacteriales bacterium]|nr:MAG: S46 family peptidase [Ignavibacteriales bacterium]
MFTSHSRFIKYFFILVFPFITAMIPTVPDEGMYPLSEIRKLDLKSAGLKISIDELYNPDGTSLIDALVNISGCTASFVSADGLMITNHHCSFGAVQRASTLENNYLENGFSAPTRDKEIPAEGITARITVSYEDVSKIILEAANKADDITKRTEAISKKISELIKAEEEKDPSIKASVSEMFTGQSYVLFRYKTINDVRLVYVPPRSIGEFGGESDNWVWPRHTGDFAFLRAYVAPDGSPAKYSEDNVPFQPKKYLKINPNGVDEEDFVFILGYPGRTYKHQPSQFLQYQENILLPYVSELYAWMMDLHEEVGKNDPEYALEISSLVKSLANTEKNYRGKLQGLSRLGLVQSKKDEEIELQKYIESKTELKSKYGNLLNDINDVYKDRFESGKLPLVIQMLSRFTTMYRVGDLYVNYKKEMQLPDAERRSSFQEKNRKTLLDQITAIYQDFRPEVDKEIMMKILVDALRFKEVTGSKLFDFVDGSKTTNESLSAFIDELYSSSEFNDAENVLALFESPDLEDDPLLDMAACIGSVKDVEDEKNKIRESKLNLLLAEFMDVKKMWKEKLFIPDANSTLRLTYGYIRGYAPADAVYYSPITTLKGVVEKGKDSGDYQLLPKIKELYNKKDFGIFTDEKLNDVPVAICYNTDTSGGNSGSPILNAYGELIGVNFDRAFEATINDFAWSEVYSRSIGVDIRYVLWVTQKVGGADYILNELGVESK